ncbi:three component ABC system middle component [Bradyrhizobium erythrophlei]|uniref:three component ABC system middle component n=1 Tax=Bradyrhizobium erythrophlei TaxID=1437360 RepID=UPI0035EC5F0E
MSSKSSPLTEVEIVQNPALGSYALWRFGLGHQSDDDRAALFPLSFLVLPLVLHRPTLDLINSTQKASGLALFAAKLGKERENLLAVHERALSLRQLTLDSIGMGVGQRLLTLNYDAATLRANALDPRTRKPTIPERIKGLSGAADKIGFWFSQLGFQQISSILIVEF